MKTKDNYEYKPGMLLYYVLDGTVVARPTRTEQGRNPENVDGVDGGSYQLDAHFAHQEPAYMEATNYWLHKLEEGRQGLAAINKERTECLLGPSTARSQHPAGRTFEHPVPVFVTPAEKPISDTLSTSGY